MVVGRESVRGQRVYDCVVGFAVGDSRSRYQPALHCGLSSIEQMGLQSITPLNL